jgi:sialidase-1
LAYAEARKISGGDWDDIDIVMRRSTDGGKSWKKLQLLADAGELAANNPVAIADRDGTVHFLHCIHYARCFYLRSADDGATFSKPVEITSAFEEFRREYNWNVIATGPGHGIQLRNGRLVVPVWLSIVSSVYSDDHGTTWKRGDFIPNTLTNMSETVPVELQDGRVMFNIRSEAPEHRRAVSFSKDGATGWTKPVFDENLKEPVCMGSIIRIPSKAILFANPDYLDPEKPRSERRNLTIKLSNDEGKTWAVSKVLDPGRSGYSDLAAGRDGSIFCLYERGGTQSSKIQFLTLVRFHLEWLTSR